MLLSHYYPTLNFVFTFVLLFVVVFELQTTTHDDVCWLTSDLLTCGKRMLHAKKKTNNRPLPLFAGLLIPMRSVFLKEIIKKERRAKKGRVIVNIDY